MKNFVIFSQKYLKKSKMAAKNDYFSLADTNAKRRGRYEVQFMNC